MMFSIPELGILFRCRAAGPAIDLEFGALFALLRFIQSKLPDQKISKLHIFSSNPEFVFSFTGNSRHLKPETERMKLLTEYNRQFQMAVSFIDAVKNQALVLAVLRARPAAAKGRYVKSIHVASTMGPGVAIDPSFVEAA